MTSVQEPVVHLDGVWASYDKSNAVLQDISMDVAEGSSYSVVGMSGSGKSTLLKLMNGMMIPSRGTVTVEGRRPDHGDAKFRKIMVKIGYIPQNLGLVRNSSVLDNVMMGALHRMGRTESLLKKYPAAEVEEAYRILKQVGLDGKDGRQAYMLSGGEKRRVAIARALMQKPRILLADELVSELDGSTAREIMGLVAEARKRTGLTVIVIHHNIKWAVEFSDQVAVIQKGLKVAELAVDNDIILDFRSGTATREEIMEVYG